MPAVLPALSEDAGEDFSAPRIFRGQLPSVLPCTGAQSTSIWAVKISLHRYAVVVSCVKMTHKLQLKKSRKKICIFSCALINRFVTALMVLVLH